MAPALWIWDLNVPEEASVFIEILLTVGREVALPEVVKEAEYTMKLLGDDATSPPLDMDASELYPEDEVADVRVA